MSDDTATFVGSSLLEGSPDVLQIMVGGGYLYTAHPFSGGFSVVDVRDPRKMRVVARVPAPPDTMTLALQLVDNFLLVTNEASPAGVARYEGLDPATEPVFAAGVRVFDVGDPDAPHEVGFCDIEGFGAHRLFWTGGDVATASVRPPDAADLTFATLDMSNPAQPVVQAVLPPLPELPDRRVGLHHAILDGKGRAFGAWRQGGIDVIDVSDPADPTRLHSMESAAWNGGHTHTTLPLPGRDLLVVADEGLSGGVEHGGIYLIDSTPGSEPSVVATFPMPDHDVFGSAPGRFGPHNLHENRPGSFVSEQIVFATLQNAGMRVYDIALSNEVTEIGSYIPDPAPEIVDPRVTSKTPCVDSADVFVDADGLAFISDMNAGITVVDASGIIDGS